jgi:hypothetical protein
MTCCIDVVINVTISAFTGIGGIALFSAGWCSYSR